MHEAHELIIIGAGPAGLAAAVQASNLGIHPLIIDYATAPGGQYFRHHPNGTVKFKNKNHNLSSLLDQLETNRVRIQLNTTVWGIITNPDQPGFTVCIEGPDQYNTRLKTKKIIISAGAYERVIPFSGWTLPGVMTSGTSSILTSRPALLKNSRVMVYGTGPLLWSTAYHLIQAGAAVISVVESNPFPWKVWKGLFSLQGQGERIAEVWEYFTTLLRHRVPVWWNSTVTQAEGEDRLDRVTISHHAGNGKKHVNLDYLFVAHGLHPSSQLALTAGAECSTHPDSKSPILLRDAGMQASVEGIFAVGDGVQIHGKDVAVLEGQLAALAVARQLGVNIPANAIPVVERQLTHWRRFTSFLNRLFLVPDHLLYQLADHVVLCRCEEVTVGDVRDLISSGVQSADTLKAITRIGMGRCQGRFCSQNLTVLLTGLYKDYQDDKSLLKPRIPVFPVTLQNILNHEVGHDD